LKDGIKPIMTAIISFDRLENITTNTVLRIHRTGEYIDYNANPAANQKLNIKQPDRYSYVISDINDKNKFSTWYCDCTGIVVVGKSKETKKNISMMSHQDPKKVLPKLKFNQNFIEDIQKRFLKIKEQSEDGTIDIVVYGRHDYSRRKYVQSIKFIGNSVKKQFGFEPVIVTGPNIPQGKFQPTAAYFDTSEKKAIFS
jgi:hypothetical protein